MHLFYETIHDVAATAARIINADVTMVTNMGLDEWAPSSGRRVFGRRSRGD